MLIKKVIKKAAALFLCVLSIMMTIVPVTAANNFNPDVYAANQLHGTIVFISMGSTVKRGVVPLTANGSYVLDVKGGSKANGANVQLYKCNRTKAQQWRVNVVDKKKGIFELINVGSGKALDVKGGKKTNGTNVQQYKRNGTNAQRWRFEGELIINVGSGKALDVKNGKVKNGTNVQIWTKKHGNKAQDLWTIDIDDKPKYVKK